MHLRIFCARTTLTTTIEEKPEKVHLGLGKLHLSNAITSRRKEKQTLFQTGGATIIQLLFCQNRKKLQQQQKVTDDDYF